MPSKTEICNMGLINIGHTELMGNIDTEHSVAARLSRMVYKLTVYSVLEDSDWSFARKTKKLAILSDEESVDYQYVYAMPDDCLKPRRIEREGFDSHHKRGVKFEKGQSSDGEKNVIFTNEPSAVLIYTTKETNETLFTSTFTEALTWRLAAKYATGLKKDMATAKECSAQAALFISSANANDANSKEIETKTVPESITLRLS